MAAALPIVAVGLSLLGGVQQAGAARQSADAQARASLYNAQMAQRNATIARQAAAADAEVMGRKQRAQIATAATMFGKYGGVNTQALDVLADSASAAELDRQTTLWKGEVRGMGYDADAVLDGYAADTAVQRGDATAGNALLTGFGKAATMMPGYSISTLGRTGSARTVGGGTAP